MDQDDQSTRLSQTFERHRDKLLFGVGVLYLSGVGLWLIHQQKLSEKMSATPPASAEEQKFIAYLQQSLQLIPASSAPSASNPSPPNNVAQPNARALTPMPPPPPTTNVAPRNGVVERYYYPVYPASPIPQAPPKPAVPKAVAPPPIARTNPVIAPMVAAKQPHTLVGVLESGAQSSALFSWDGLTQRIQVGESIGGSGWALSSVSNQKAILSRQGKTRYLEVGQSF